MGMRKRCLPALPLGTALVTLFKKIRPFKRRGVFLFLLPDWPKGMFNGGGAGFLRIELLLLTFFALGPVGVYSLQQRMIFSKRKTWYSLSISDLVTVKMSSRRRAPKFDMW